MRHPSEEVFCEKSRKLEGKKIILGITGSIAVVECFGLTRELIRHGAEVYPVMTGAAIKLVTPDTMHFASGHQPVTELTGLTEHILMMSDADLLLIYPATANTISKIACGIDDTTVTSMATVAIGSHKPVAIAPAMHQSMFDNPAVSENIEKLKSWGVEFIGPRKDGIRAKAATLDEVVANVMRILGPKSLSGKKVLVIGGRSEEPIDSMRLITNRSSGKMAVSIAVSAFEKGADVELWMGGCDVSLPSYISTKRFGTVAELVEMLDFADHDIAIVPAALADFAPKDVKDGKIPSDKGFDMKLEPVEKALSIVAKKCKRVIGFKAESGLKKDELASKARSRLDEYGLYAIVANDVSAAGKEDDSVLLVTASSSKEISGSKDDVASAITDLCSS